VQEKYERLKRLLVREEMEDLRSLARRGDQGDPPIELPEDLRERLRSLGYVQ
jgi:hypothetical protein